MTKPARWFLLSMLVVCVPAQAVLGVTAGQCMALQHHQDGGGQAGHGDEGHSHSGIEHGKKSEAHCGPCAGCCASAAIAGSILSLPAEPVQGTASSAIVLPRHGNPPDGIDRPPRSL